MELKRQDEHQCSDVEQYGIDLWLLNDNLQLSPDERLVKHQQALDLVFELEGASKTLET